MSYSTGYIPDPEDHRVTSIRVKLAANVAVPDSVDHRPHSPDVLDQNGCGSCTGHAVAGAITTAFSLAGDPLGFVVSPRNNYCLSRCIDRYDPDVPLVDQGAMPNQNVRAFSEYGLMPMRAPSPLGYNSDCDPSNVNNEPLLSELEEDAQHIVLGQYEITSGGAQRVQDICAALAHNYPVTCSVSAGNSTWQTWRPENGPLGAQSPVNRDHYVRFIGYRTENGGRVFRLRNQWGIGWGAGGDIEVTEAFVDQIGDIYAFSVRKAL